MTAALVISGFLLLFCGVYIWLLFPSVRRRDIGSLCARPIAHRGVHDGDSTDENSLASFAIAVNSKLPIELDVRLTSDRVPVVMHDADLRRMCGVDVRVSELTAEEFTSYTFSKSGEHLPTLAEVLSLADGKVPLLIELKGSDRSPVAEECAKLLGTYSGKFAVQSFNPYYLYRYRRTDKTVPLGFLTERHSAKSGFFPWAASRSLVNFMFRPDFIAYGYTKKLPFSIRLAKRLGCRLLVWTVRDKETYDDSVKRFDGIIAERIGEITK